jgi:hypothetical protein
MNKPIPLPPVQVVTTCSVCRKYSSCCRRVKLVKKTLFRRRLKIHEGHVCTECMYKKSFIYLTRENVVKANVPKEGYSIYIGCLNDFDGAY